MATLDSGDVAEPREPGPATPVNTELDPSRSYFITIVGRKGSGKSYLASRFWETCPADRLVIDPTGDAELGEVDDLQELQDPLPMRWPKPAEDRRSSLRYLPDPGSPSYRDDLDRAVSLAFNNRGSFLWVDEAGELSPSANQVGPWTRRALQQGRHRKLSMALCMIRPQAVDPLMLSQADLVYVFDLPNPRDRRRVAETVGYDPRELDRAVHELGHREYLRWDGTELVHFPALPPRRRRPAPRTDDAGAEL